MGATALLNSTDDPLSLVSEMVAAQPGATRFTLAGRLTGRREARYALLQEAVDRQLVHEEPVRGGRTMTGLFPGPPGQEVTPPPLSADELGRRRTAAQLSRRALARRLDVSEGLVRHWEAGRKRIPSWASERVTAVLDETCREREALVLPMPAPNLRSAVLAAVSGATPPGIHRTELRQRVGHGRAVLEALQHALDAGELHEREVAQKGRRPVRLVYPGPAPKGPARRASSPRQVRALRQRTGATQASLGRRLGVSHGVVQRWETGRTPVPQWAEPRLRQAAEKAAAARVDHDTLARRGLMGKVAERPGIARQELLRSVGATTVHRRVLDELVAAGALHVETTPAGRRIRLYAAAPTALSGSELTRRRRESGLAQRELGASLGVGVSTVAKWEAAERVPQRWADQLLKHLDAVGTLEDRLLAAVNTEPRTRERLTRGEFGRGQQVQETLDRLLAADMLHVGARRTLRPGPAPTRTAAAELPVDLAAARRSKGLSQRDVGKLLGVSGTVVGNWERGLQPVPADRRPAYAAVLAAEGERPALAPPTRVTDEDLERLALLTVGVAPGLSRRALAVRLLGTTSRRYAAVRRLVEDGRIVERPGRRSPELYVSRPGVLAGGSP